MEYEDHLWNLIEEEVKKTMVADQIVHNIDNKDPGPGGSRVRRLNSQTLILIGTTAFVLYLAGVPLAHASLR